GAVETQVATEMVGSLEDFRAADQRQERTADLEPALFLEFFRNRPLRLCHPLRRDRGHAIVRRGADLRHDLHLGRNVLMAHFLVCLSRSQFASPARRTVAASPPSTTNSAPVM